MSKRQGTKKKRSKAYTGNDATASQPVIHRYQAEVKSPFREWWEAKKGPTKIVGGVIAVLGFLSWLLIEAIRIIF